MMGSFFSTVTTSTTILTAAYQIPQCDGSSSSFLLSNKRTYPYFFRTVSNDMVQALAIFQYVYTRGWKRVAILYSDESYGIGLYDTFVNNAANYSDFQIVQALKLENNNANPQANQISWDRKLQILKKLDVYVVVVFSVYTISDYAIGNSTMYSDNYAWLGSDGVSTTLPGFTLFKFYKGRGSVNDQFNAMAVGKFTASRSVYYAGCIELILRGLDKFMTANPQYNLTQLASRSLNKYFSVPSMFAFPDILTPVGPGNLDANGDLPGQITVNYIDRNSTLVSAGYYDLTTNFVNMSRPIVYPNGGTKTPLDDVYFGDYLTTVETSSAIGGTFIGLNMLTCLLIIGCFVFYLSHSKDRAIKSSSLELQFLSLLGLLLACFDVFTMTGVITKSQCIADIWLLGIPYTVVMGCIVIRLNRIYRIFNGLKIGVQGTSSSAVLIQLGMIVGVEVIYLAIWSAVDPPVPTLIKLGTRNFKYTCNANNQSVWVGIIIAYNLLLLAAGTIFAALTGSVSQDFNETQTVGMTSYSHAILSLVGLGLLLSLGQSLDLVFSFVIKQAVLLLLVWVTLGFMFMKRIYDVHSKGSSTPSSARTSSVSKIPTKKTTASDGLSFRVHYRPSGLFGNFVSSRLYFFQKDDLLVFKRLMATEKENAPEKQSTVDGLHIFLGDYELLKLEKVPDNAFRLRLYSESKLLVAIEFPNEPDMKQFQTMFAARGFGGINARKAVQTMEVSMIENQRLDRKLSTTKS
ncbi:7 transmembrane sweet-taste receptor of 3 GCPR-domain-containing protein [Gorgonomyces haynaldii]|nr:7 transmembrane sweet-taste receptor of 3 GCPR-domain-containing protein [Gorgonomyces haynaldii]